MCHTVDYVKKHRLGQETAVTCSCVATQNAPCVNGLIAPYKRTRLALPSAHVPRMVSFVLRGFA